MKSHCLVHEICIYKMDNKQLKHLKTEVLAFTLNDSHFSSENISCISVWQLLHCLKIVILSYVYKLLKKEYMPHVPVNNNYNSNNCFFYFKKLI